VRSAAYAALGKRERGTFVLSNGRPSMEKQLTAGRRVSVVVPTYNRAEFLEDTLASVFGQTIPVHEVILLDDGSTDDTANRVRHLCAHHPDRRNRLRYIRQHNQGKSAALNVALRVASGEWIAFNDSDDRWLPDKLELQFESLARYSAAGACFTDVRFVNNPAIEQGAFAQADLHYGDTFGLEPRPYLFAVDLGIYMQTVLVRADVMHQFGEFDTRVRMSMDTDFVFRLGLITPMCFVNRPLVEVDRRESRVGLMTEHPLGSVERLQTHEYLRMKWLALVGRSQPRLAAYLLEKLTSTRSELANRHLLCRENKAARLVLRNAVMRNPTAPMVAKWVLAVVAPELLRRQILRREASRVRRRRALADAERYSPAGIVKS
jgi:glycosyltransferase involved in cell wall biosynthesis